jgi:hypothetical protein
MAQFHAAARDKAMKTDREFRAFVESPRDASELLAERAAEIVGEARRRSRQGLHLKG